jgi:hypothetical protein
MEGLSRTTKNFRIPVCLKGLSRITKNFRVPGILVEV